MSSDDDMYSSEESYEFEFEDDEEMADNDVDQDSGSGNEQSHDAIENAYYNAKALKDEDDSLALEKFKKIIALEPAETTVEFIFKSTKQIAKILFMKRELNNCLEHLSSLDRVISQINNKSYVEDSINKMVAYYTNINNNQFVAELYEVLLSLLNHLGSNSGTDRIWIKINLSKFNLHLNSGNFEQSQKLIAEVNKKLDASAEGIKNSFQLEAIACEIELLSMAPELDLKMLNTLYKKSNAVISPVTHPRIMGVIKECGGKIEFYRRDFEKARLNFYESFKFFDESGSNNKKQALKYLILCSIITSSEFNPFESQETQHYARLQEFEKLILIIEYCNELDLHGFRSIINIISNGNDPDPFFKEELFKLAAIEIEQNLMIKIVLNLIKSYSVVSFRYIEELLGVHQDHLETLLIKLGNSGRLKHVMINFVDQKIEIKRAVCTPINLPINLDAESIFTNLKCLEASGLFLAGIDFDSDSNFEIPIDPPRAFTNNRTISDRYMQVVNKLLLFPKEGSKHALLETIDTWLSVLKSSFPEVVTDELSTKDQIFNEQKAERSGNLEVLNQINLNELNELRVDLLDNREKLRVMQVWVKKLFDELAA